MVRTGNIVFLLCVKLGQLAHWWIVFLGKHVDVVKFFLSTFAKELRFLPAKLGHHVGLVVHLERGRGPRNALMSLLLVWGEEIPDG